MLDRLFSSHLTNLEKGLDRTSKRQGLLMNNLANANVPGYKRQDIDFNVALDDAMGSDGFAKIGGAGNGEIVESEGEVRYDKSSVDPEQEALGIAQMEMRFQTIADLTAGYFSGLKNAIREGR